MEYREYYYRNSDFDDRYKRTYENVSGWWPIVEYESENEDEDEDD